MLALVLAAVAVLFSVVAMRRSARRPLPTPRQPAKPVPSPSTGATPSSGDIEPGNAIDQDTAASLVAAITTSLRHVAVVRYDAFDDVSGRQSFTAAILDDNNDGIVITSLHARTESRTLLKGITAGEGEGLSPEEQQAVDQARGGQ
jgi:hypothetical protein